MDADQKESILIVDNDLSICETFSRILNAAGYVTTTVNNGKSAIKQVQKYRFDLVFVSVNLPDMKANKILTQFDKGSYTMDIVLVGDQASSESLSLTAVESKSTFLIKPFEKDSLLAVVDKSLERKRLLNASLRAKEQMLENEERMCALIESLPVMVHAIDEDRKTIVWNQECEKVTEIGRAHV